MSVQFFLFRELLGAIRTRSAVFFALAGALLFLFLASVAGLLMLSPGDPSVNTEGQPIEEIRVFLSPRLSSATIDGWFLEWREREDIARLRFQFAQEYDDATSGGVFIVTPADPAAAGALAEELGEVDGVTRVVQVPREPTIEISAFSLVIRITLLVIMVLCITACLLLSRRGYRELLTMFSGEIRLLRLSGISERVLFALVIALGVLIGVLGGLFLWAFLVLLHLIALSHASAFSLFGGLARGARILEVGLVVLALGTALGGLAGLLGASLLHGREFDPLP